MIVRDLVVKVPVFAYYDDASDGAHVVGKGTYPIAEFIPADPQVGIRQSTIIFMVGQSERWIDPDRIQCAEGLSHAEATIVGGQFVVDIP